MRNTFIQTLTELAAQDPRIIFLTADLGYTVVEPFANRFPNRFFNVGVAEQNMIGMATGMAEAGYIPFVYSISNFACLRPYEFIRNGPVHHQLPVRIVGVGAGFDYGSAGITHYNLEDVGALRIQKGLKIIVPVDNEQTKTALLKTWNLPGPSYYRLGKGEKKQVPNLNGNFDLGQAQRISDGKDVVFICMGTISHEVIEATDALSNKGIFSSVVIVSSFNPSPEQDIVKILKDFPLAITVEDHYITGGLGSFVAEVVAENGLATQLVRCGIRGLVEETGSRAFMNDKYGISSQKLVKTAIDSLKKIGNAKPSHLYNSSYTQTV